MADAVRLRMLALPGVEDFATVKLSDVSAVTPAILRVRQQNPLAGGRVTESVVGSGAHLIINGYALPVAMTQEEALALLGWTVSEQPVPPKEIPPRR